MNDSTSSAEASHDVVVAGGGLAGTSLAIGLKQAGFDVALVEAVARTAQSQPSQDDRTLVINRASINILRNLGVFDDDLAQCPIRRIDVSRAGGFGHFRLNAGDHGLDRFGAVVVARELGARLTRQAQAVQVAEYCPERVETFQVEDDEIKVRLASGQRLRARLLVAADGTGSAIRQAANIASTLHDYRQSAMILNLRAEPESSDIAHERFTPDGPLALLPQPAGRYGAVVIGPTSTIDEAMEWDDERLLDWIRSKASAEFRRFSDPGKRARYPLKLLRSPAPIGRRVVAIGNAANTVHPVSAQGLNLGLRDVAGLIEALEEAHDPGAPVWLARYVQARKHDQAETVRYTDTLARTFSNPSLPFRVGGGLGLAAHALLPGLRRRLVSAAMGFREPVARMAREG